MTARKQTTGEKIATVGKRIARVCVGDSWTEESIASRIDRAIARAVKSKSATRGAGKKGKR